MLKIAFIGLTNSFDFNHIGGASALIRRITIKLAEMGDQVDFVQYGTNENAQSDIRNNIKQKNCRTFTGLLDQIKENYDHIVSVYIKPVDRISFIRFRKASQRQTVFHHLYLNWSESRLKRQLYFAEAKIAQLNGLLFCVSPRIYHHVSKWSKRAVLLLPSVEEKYFLKPSEKNNSSKLRIAYLGRVDPGKGTMAAVEIVRRLASLANIESRICGFSWPRLPDTVSLEKKLLTDPSIRYESVEPDKWTDAVDDNLRTLLRETDVLLLPYQKLSSTIDTPLLLLEAMASLCAVVTKPLGNIPEIYGESKFLISADNFLSDAVALLQSISLDDIHRERKRIYEQNKILSFQAANITRIFLDALGA